MSTELQEAWKKTIGDRFYCTATCGTKIHFLATQIQLASGYECDFWLPYQEDLQALLEKEGKRPDFGFLPVNCIDIYPWNELWLSVYMQEVHGKYWDDEKWCLLRKREGEG